MNNYDAWLDSGLSAQELWEKNFEYFEKHFTVEQADVYEAFANHGRKNSLPDNDEKFLHHSWQYHAWKAFTHFIRSLFRRVDADSGHDHNTLMILRMYMAKKVREK